MVGWHVLGAGAIGQLFAHHLRSNGASVTILLRSRDALVAFQQAEESITVQRQLPGGPEIASEAEPVALASTQTEVQRTPPAWGLGNGGGQLLLSLPSKPLTVSFAHSHEGRLCIGSILG